jgi:hypothetical protein
MGSEGERPAPVPAYRRRRCRRRPRRTAIPASSIQAATVSPAARRAGVAIRRVSLPAPRCAWRGLSAAPQHRRGVTRAHGPGRGGARLSCHGRSCTTRASRAAARGSGLRRPATPSGRALGRGTGGTGPGRCHGRDERRPSAREVLADLEDQLVDAWPERLALEQRRAPPARRVGPRLDQQGPLPRRRGGRAPAGEARAGRPAEVSEDVRRQTARHARVRCLRSVREIVPKAGNGSE